MQELEHGAWHGAVTAHQGEDGGEVSARAVTADREASRVDAEPFGVPGEEAQRGGAILDGGGKRVLGSQAVVDREHAAAGGGGDAATNAVVGVEVAEHPAATVQEQEAGRGDLCGAAIEPARYVPARPGDGERFDGGDRFGRQLQLAAGLGVAATHLDRRQGAERRRVGGAQHGCDVGVQLGCRAGHARPSAGPATTTPRHSPKPMRTKPGRDAPARRITSSPSSRNRRSSPLASRSGSRPPDVVSRMLP